MFRRALPLLSTVHASVVTKTSTGLVGLRVHPNPLPALVAVNRQCIALASSLLPSDSFYRLTVEKVANYRIKVVEDAKGDIDIVEGEIDCGQVEELIIQGEDELECIKGYAKAKLWEGLESKEVKNL